MRLTKTYLGSNQERNVHENQVQPEDFPDNILLLQDKSQGVRSILE